MFLIHWFCSFHFKSIIAGFDIDSILQNNILVGNLWSCVHLVRVLSSFLPAQQFFLFPLADGLCNNFFSLTGYKTGLKMWVKCLIKRIIKCEFCLLFHGCCHIFWMRVNLLGYLWLRRLDCAPLKSLPHFHMSLS